MTSLPFDAAIFDLDGVITKTSTLHSAAWERAFNDYLTEYSASSQTTFREFTYEGDYLPYVDGKPRYQGVRSFLESRDISLPFGNTDDAPGFETICAIGNLKNRYFNDLLQQGQIEIYQSTIDLINQLKKHGIRIGVASSSKNCRAILAAAKLEDLFGTRVDGIVSEDLGLTGKPSPDIFLTATKNLDSTADRSIVFEDANSGVQAGRDGNFGLVVGLARAGNKRELLVHGADLVVEDLSELPLNKINDWFTSDLEEDSWTILYHDYKPENEGIRETLLTVGNGYFATRGALEEQSANEINYPGTYIAGLYNRLETELHGQMICNEDFVNCPNWLPVHFKIDRGEWVDLNNVEILEITRSLDLQSGLLTKKLLINDSKGRITQIKSRRFASMDDPHLAGLRYELTPLNYSGTVSVRSSIQGGVINAGVERYKALNSKHLQIVQAGGSGVTSHLEVVTSQSEIHIAEAVKLHVDLDGQELAPEFTHIEDGSEICTTVTLQIEKGNSVGIEKLVSIYTSQDWDTETPLQCALDSLEDISRFDDIYQNSVASWKQIWNQVDIQIQGDRWTQKLIRLNLYHILASASPNNSGIDASIPARGLHGEAYRGHIFWDELFILPLLSLTLPDITRAALKYRYKRIQAARDYAHQFGYNGAMYPWQSGSTGKEETQIIHLNPLSGEWGPDNSALQRHVSLAIAYNIWFYYLATGDRRFLENCGGEMFLEICRFWSSAVSFNKDSGRYEIHRVMGPDEFHEGYPDSSEGGLSNNAYTNIMVIWALSTAEDILGNIRDAAREHLMKKIQLTNEELEKWSQIRESLRIPINDSGIIEQFDGFFSLQELDWSHYKAKYGDIHRMDRIIKNEGKSPDAYLVIKQADALMAFYNLDPDQIEDLITQTNQSWKVSLLEKNIQYYLKRTSHGSTLSFLTHAYLCSLIDDKELSWKFFQKALRSDYEDIQGGTTGEGIHAGVMAGSIYHVLRVYGGISFQNGELHCNPSLPDHWRELGFQVTYRDQGFRIRVTPSSVRAKSISSNRSQLIYRGKPIQLTNSKWEEIYTKQE
jgi:beta-phosphoglucomutase family hydrolase